MTDFCTAIAALIEQAPNKSTRRVLEAAQMLAK